MSDIAWWSWNSSKELKKCSALLDQLVLTVFLTPETTDAGYGRHVLSHSQQSTLSISTPMQSYLVLEPVHSFFLSGSADCFTLELHGCYCSVQ